MGIIQELGTQIDAATVDYLQAVFTAVADPVKTLMESVGVVALLFIALNHIFQVQSVHYSKYLSWGVTYIIVISFATLWSNFSPVYNALTGITQGYSNLVVEAVAKNIETLREDILDPGKITGAGEAKTYAAMDEFGHAIVWISGDFFRDTSITNLGKTFRNVFSGIVVLIVGGIFIAASAVMILIAKVGMILAISLAPLGIMMFMWDKTRHYFQGWVSLLIGFSVIPLLLGCLMAIVLYFAAHLLATSGASSQDKSLFWPFVFVMIAALVLLFHIPTMAQTLASTSVAVGGGSVARGLTSLGGRMSGISNVLQYAQALPQRALGQMLDPRKYAHGAYAGAGALRSGASLQSAAMAAYGGWRRHTAARKGMWENGREGRIKGPARYSPNPAFQNRPPQATPSSSGTGQGSGSGSGQMSPELRNQYRK